MEFRHENWFCKWSCFYCVSWNLANTFHNRVMSATLIPKEDNHFHSWDEWRPRHMKSRSVCNPLLLLNSLLIFTSLLAGDGIVGIHCHIANTWYSVIFKTICLLLLLFLFVVVVLWHWDWTYAHAGQTHYYWLLPQVLFNSSVETKCHQIVLTDFKLGLLPPLASAS